jgi:hypothetical protein
MCRKTVLGGPLLPGEVCPARSPSTHRLSPDNYARDPSFGAAHSRRASRALSVANDRSGVSEDEDRRNYHAEYTHSMTSGLVIA